MIIAGLCFGKDRGILQLPFAVMLMKCIPDATQIH